MFFIEHMLTNSKYLNRRSEMGYILQKLSFL